MKATAPKPKLRRFTVEGVEHSAKTQAFNDAFYEITAGKWKGNLIHIYNMIDKY